MNEDKPIPDIIVSRLPLYLRVLQQIEQHGQRVTSSRELAKRLGLTAAQIRKDLSQFGEFGKQGTGYPVKALIERLQNILHIDQVWKLAVVGAGDVGHAVARYPGFANRGYRVALIFDNDPGKVGRALGPYTVQDSRKMTSIIREEEIQIAMIAVPEAFAQEVADQLVQAGVKAILNYAPITLTVPPGVQVQNIDPVAHLQHMTYYLD
jgi:redox-sensing transcriptional repressor